MNTTTAIRLQQKIAALENALSEKKRQLERAQAIISPSRQPVEAQPEMSLRRAERGPKVQRGIKPDFRINNHSSPETKIALFRSLFRGREAMYAKRFESKKTGKPGYQPACKNERVKGVCEKPKTSCGKCARRDFEPVSDAAIRNHLAGFVPAQSGWPPPQPFVMGVYPLLQVRPAIFWRVPAVCAQHRLLRFALQTTTHSPQANATNPGPSAQTAQQVRAKRGLALFFDVVFSAEALNPAGGVNQLLFAGKERMAGGTNFHFDILHRGTGFNHVSAGTGNFGHLIPGMNLVFHIKPLNAPNSSSGKV